MNIGVVLARRSQIKFLGSVIHEAVRRLHRVTLFIEPWGTPEQRFVKEDLPWFLRAAVKYQYGAMPIWDGPVIVHEHEIHKVPRYTGTALGPNPVRIFGISYFFTNLIRSPWPPELATVFYHSDYHQARHKALYPEHAAWIDEQPVCGWTGGDHVRELASPEHIRHRYGLATAPTVIFTPKRVVREPLLAKVARRAAYARMVWGATHCVTTGPLRFKTRAKHKDPVWLRWLAPVIGDDSLYPSTAFELLSIARHVHLGMTGAIHEAQWLKTPFTLWPTSFAHATDQPGVAQTIADVTALDVEEMLGPRSQHAAANILDVIEGG